jgi:hypothetical protein
MDDIPFDAIITLLVFLIGVPALVAQSMPTEVRRVVMKRSSRLQITTLFFVGLAALVIAGGAVLAAPTGNDDRPVWGGVTTLLFLIVALAALRIVGFYGRRDTVVHALAREARRELANGRLAEGPLAEMIALGIQSHPGQDKGLVLQDLQELTERVCEHPRYRGDRLETLIVGLVDVLTSGPRPWSPQNFDTAAGILKQIVITFSAKGSPEFRDVDLVHAVRVLSELGQAALTLDNEHTPMHYMQALASTGNRHRGIATAVSQALFELGEAAIEKKQLFVAVAALDRLSTLVETYAPARGELAADALGLLAHFWRAGDSAQGYALRKLSDLSQNLALELPAALKAAREHYAQRTRFHTADKLYQLIEDLRARPFDHFLWTIPGPEAAQAGLGI